jgi:signal transduction histidine kinase
MKLFSKTLLFFIGVIVFQAILAVFLTSNITGRANLADARGELEKEASILYDSFNSWKRQIWMSLIGISNDRDLARALAAFRGRPPEQGFTGALGEFFLVSKIDCLILDDPSRASRTIVPVTYSTFELEDLRGLVKSRSHPYIELCLIGNTLCLSGVTSIAAEEGSRLDVILLKRIDGEFCSQLTLNRRSHVAFFLGSRYLIGSFPAGSPALSSDPGIIASSYLERYNERLGNERLNIAYQRIGRIGGGEGEELIFGTFLSNEPFNQRILQVRRAVLLVSIAGALLTILLSLFLSRNITHPIADLLSAMERIKKGAYDTQVGPREGYEISRLFAGFNKMARELQQSRTEMQEYIREILLLKEYNEKIINSIKASIAIVNRDLVVEKANSSFIGAFALAGRQVIGIPLKDLSLEIVDDALLKRIAAILAREQEFFQEVKRSHSNRVYEIKLYPFYSSEGEFHEASGCVFLAEDISARTELEHKIFQAEKLASISMLSAGMAHEINNPLSSILTNVQNLMDEEMAPERRVSLGWIEQETRRIARIVRELLNFASMDSKHPPGSDVNRVIEETVRLIGYSLSREREITITTRLAPELPQSAISTDELQQVAINLIRNSVQAVDGAGRILICTSLNRRKGMISFSVADTGKGIPKQNISRIFDPFFTTKENGEGTGLGLSVVYGIVTKYNGEISVRSQGRGNTRIGLSLPLLHPGARQPRPEKEKA